MKGCGRGDTADGVTPQTAQILQERSGREELREPLQGPGEMERSWGPGGRGGMGDTSVQLAGSDNPPSFMLTFLVLRRMYTPGGGAGVGGQDRL